MERVTISLLVNLRANQKPENYKRQVEGAFDDWAEVKGVAVTVKHATKADEAELNPEEETAEPAKKATVKPVEAPKSAPEHKAPTAPAPKPAAAATPTAKPAVTPAPAAAKPAVPATSARLI